MPEKVVKFTHIGQCDLCGSTAEVFYAPVSMSNRVYSCCLACMRRNVRTRNGKAGALAPAFPSILREDEIRGYYDIDEEI